jgi:hypothetical protein
MLPEEEIRLLKSFYKEEGISDLLEEYFIDYSHIKDTKFREYLESINRKMIKARIRNDFDEYCRYAFMQIEAITNKYIKLKLKDFDSWYIEYAKEIPQNDKRISKNDISIKLIYSIKENSSEFDQNDPFWRNEDKKKDKKKTPYVHEIYRFISNLKTLRNYLSHGDADRELDEYVKRISRDKDWNKIRQIIKDYYQCILENKI